MFFVAKMREAFAVQKRLSFFNKKCWQISDINILNFNDRLTNDVVKEPLNLLEHNCAYIFFFF